MDMDVGTMARGRLKLSQDILEDMVVMAVDMDMGGMDMEDMAIMVNSSFEFHSKRNVYCQN